MRITRACVLSGLARIFLLVDLPEKISDLGLGDEKE